MTALIMSMNMAAAVFADFDDIHGHWSAPFVEDLERVGVVSGDNGSYNPDSYITAAEFIKMTACALGYQPAAYGAYWAAPYIESVSYTHLRLFVMAVGACAGRI